MMNPDATLLVYVSLFLCLCQISSMFLTRSDLQSPESLTSHQVSDLAPFLPLLGSDFLQRFGPSQLLPVLGDLAEVPFTSTQV